METMTSSSRANATAAATAGFTMEQGWIVAQTVNVVVFIGAVWAIINFVAYGARSGRWRRQTPDEREASHACIVLTSAVVSAAMVLPCVLLSEAVILIGLYAPPEFGDRLCEAAIDANDVFVLVCIFTIYAFLWYRQRALYMQPSIRHMYTPVVRLASWACLASIVAVGVACTALFVAPRAYRRRGANCVLRRSQHERKVTTAFVLAISSMIVSQLVLLALFLYPLRKHRRRTTAPSRGSRASTFSNTRGRSMVKRRVRRLILRATCSIVLCVASQMASMLVATFALPVGWPVVLSRAVYNVCLYFNVLAAMFSFDRWREIARAVCAGPRVGGIRRDSPRSDKRAAVHCDLRVRETSSDVHTGNSTSDI